VFTCTLVVTEAVVAETDGLRKHPSITVVLCQECVHALFFEVVEGDEGEDGVAEFWVLILVHAPEPFGVECACEFVGCAAGEWVVAVSEDPGEVILVQTVKVGDDCVEDAAEAEAFLPNLQKTLT